MCIKTTFKPHNAKTADLFLTIISDFALLHFMKKGKRKVKNLTKSYLLLRSNPRVEAVAINSMGYLKAKLSGYLLNTY